MATDLQQTHRHATFLIKNGMRIALVHSITGMSWRALRDLWETWHGSDMSPPGRLPCSTLAYIKSGQSQVALSTLVAVYLSLEKEQPTPADAFIDAWKTVGVFADKDTSLDINAGWYAVRDTKAGLLAWCKCKACKAGYFFDAKETRKKSICTFCGSPENSLTGLTQCK